VLDLVRLSFDLVVRGKHKVEGARTESVLLLVQIFPGATRSSADPRRFFGLEPFQRMRVRPN